MGNSISWKEGMFLLPQHFQYQEQHFEQQLANSAFVSHSYNYGFDVLELDPEALGNWHVAVNRASGRSKLGYLFKFAANEIPRIDLKTYESGDVKRRLDAGEEVDLFLAFPLVRPNIKSISVFGTGIPISRI